MEYDKLFIAAAVVFIAVIAFFGTNGIATYYNAQYGVAVGQDSNLVNSINNINNNLTNSFGTMGATAGAGVEGEEGAGSTDTNTNLATRALNIISAIKSMIGLGPAMLQDATVATGVGEDYVWIANTLFIILFALAFAYLLFLGINK